jgi:hypothetical protein
MLKIINLELKVGLRVKIRISSKLPLSYYSWGEQGTTDSMCGGCLIRRICQTEPEGNKTSVGGGGQYGRR